MNPIARTLLTLSLPIVMVFAIALALLVIALDLLALPFVLLARKSPSDQRPPERNASVVVLNWNGVDFLRELMPSLRVAVERCPGDHEVIVVDNGSDDDSRAFLEAEHSWAKLVKLPEALRELELHGVAALTEHVLTCENGSQGRGAEGGAAAACWPRLTAEGGAAAAFWLRLTAEGGAAASSDVEVSLALPAASDASRSTAVSFGLVVLSTSVAAPAGTAPNATEGVTLLINVSAAAADSRAVATRPACSERPDDSVWAA